VNLASPNSGGDFWIWLLVGLALGVAMLVMTAFRRS
jgi:hypothetical protein